MKQGKAQEPPSLTHELLTINGFSKKGLFSLRVWPMGGWLWYNGSPGTNWTWQITKNTKKKKEGRKLEREKEGRVILERIRKLKWGVNMIKIHRMKVSKCIYNRKMHTVFLCTGVWCRWQQGPEENVRSPEAGVWGDRKLSSMDAVNYTQVQEKYAFLTMRHLSSP